MRAIVVDEFGPPEGLRVAEVQAPVPGPGEVLVETHAAPVNYVDMLVVAGTYQFLPPFPFIPGKSPAGVVTALGPGVTALRVGDRVLAMAETGGYAEAVTIEADQCHRLPPPLSYVEAAAAAVVYDTSWVALRSRARLPRAETVLVLGAAGGVGLASVELATLLGGKVVAAASTPEKLELCAQYGAVAGIDYTKEDLKTRAKELTGGGADVVVDPVGGPYSEQALRATKWGSRFVVIGFAAGEIPRIPLNLILLKGTILRGMEMRSIMEAVPELVLRDQRELQELFVGGKIHPHVSAIYPLADTAIALRSMLERTATGKVLIDVNQ